MGSSPTERMTRPSGWTRFAEPGWTSFAELAWTSFAELRRT